jgi:hypothetical protein
MVVTGLGVAGEPATVRVGAAVGEVVWAGGEGGIAGWVHPDAATRRMRAIPERMRSHPGEEDGEVPRN